MAEADAMVDAVERNGVRFNYGTQRRYVPLYQEIRKRVDSGELGSIDCVIVQQGTSAALWGLTHGSDLMLYLAGDPEVEFVQGTILCEEDDWEGRRLNADPGIAAGYVRFANGIHGYFTAGRGAEFEVCGAEGKIRTFDNGLSWRLRKQSRGGQAMEDASIPDIPLESGTVSGILDIAEAIDSGRETRGPVQLARRSQEMLMAIIESHRLGGIRIPLPMASRDLYVGREGW
jgi:predicted dehydrogenase